MCGIFLEEGRDLVLQHESWKLVKVELTHNSLTWKIWWAPNNASRWHMGFNSVFKGLNMLRCYINCEHLIILTCKSSNKTIVLRFFINCQLHSCAKHTIDYTCYKCVVVMYLYIYIYMGTTVAQWLRCCATNWKVAGSIPASVIAIFHWHKILPIALWSWGRLSL